MGIYSTQRHYFKEAYVSGEHGWPVEDPSAHIIRFVKRFKRGRSIGRVLDLGCGEGRHTVLFAKNGYYSVGLDYQPLAIKRAISLSRSQGLRSGFSFVLGDLFQLPFRSASFNVLIDYGCLHHVKKSDFGAYLKSVLPLLSSQGHLLLSCFSTKFKHHPGERRSRDWLVHRGHYDRFFRKGEFKSLFGKYCKIHSVEEERQELYAFFHVWMQKKG